MNFYLFGYVIKLLNVAENLKGFYSTRYCNVILFLGRIFIGCTILTPFLAFLSCFESYEVLKSVVPTLFHCYYGQGFFFSNLVVFSSFDGNS